MKFKEGDLIVVLNHPKNIYKIVDVDLNDEEYPYRVVGRGLPNTWFAESELEFSKVYNSPLYKALL